MKTTTRKKTNRPDRIVRIGQSNFYVKHNGQSTWDATTYLAETGGNKFAIDNKTPVTWQDQVKDFTVPVHFHDTPRGRQQMQDFIAAATKRIVIGISHTIPKPGEKRSYKEPSRIAEVEFDPALDAITRHEDRPNKFRLVLWCRIKRYIA